MSFDHIFKIGLLAIGGLGVGGIFYVGRKVKALDTNQKTELFEISSRVGALSRTSDSKILMVLNRSLDIIESVVNKDGGAMCTCDMEED